MKKLAVLAGAASLALAGVTLAGCGGSGPAATTATEQANVPFDRAFIDAMVPHHQQAIEMAQAAKAAGLSQPELVAIADEIIDTQQAEIDQMLGWRQEWFGSATVDPAGANQLGMSMDVMGMGGAPTE